MRSSPARRFVASLCTVGTFGALVALTPTAGAEAPQNVNPAKLLPSDRDLLPSPQHGRAAVRALAADLPVAAERNDLDPEGLRELLLADAAAWVDGDGRLFYKEPVHAQPASAAAQPGAFPSADTFLLHSSPGSRRTIYLDFDGATVRGTYWNEQDPGMATEHPAWSLDADPSTFSVTERNAVQLIFSAVAEDYAPFDVDVTTEDPGAAALDRSGAADLVYGMRALITPSASAVGSICGGGGCGGVAYVGVFSLADSSAYQPAWVFPQMLSNDAKAIAEAVTHEVGHTLGLVHDGKGADEYYVDAGLWAPIMGAGYNSPVTQWSNGDYPGATNPQDDLAVISSGGLPARTDDASDVPSGAVALGSADASSSQGRISTRADRDVFRAELDCTGSLSASVQPAAWAANLDVRLRLLDSSGTVLATDDPESALVSRSSASGLGAALTRTLGSGTYFLEVDGVGSNPGTATGYSDYGSLGAFTLEVAGCLGASPAPGRVGIGTARSGAIGGAISATAKWALLSGSTVTGYRVTALRLSASGAVVGRTRSGMLAATRNALAMPLPRKGRYAFVVTAFNSTVAGTPSRRSNIVTAR